MINHIVSVLREIQNNRFLWCLFSLCLPEKPWKSNANPQSKTRWYQWKAPFSLVPQNCTSLQRTNTSDRLTLIRLNNFCHMEHNLQILKYLFCPKSRHCILLQFCQLKWHYFPLLADDSDNVQNGHISTVDEKTYITLIYWCFQTGKKLATRCFQHYLKWGKTVQVTCIK